MPLMSASAPVSRQSGMMLLEALIAILVFSIGILGMVGINARAVQAASDAEYRSDAARYADEIAGLIALNVDRSSEASLASSLATVTAASSLVITDWKTRVTAAGTGLPGAQNLQVVYSEANFNRVTITIGWKAPADTVIRSHQLITYIN